MNKVVLRDSVMEGENRSKRLVAVNEQHPQPVKSSVSCFIGLAKTFLIGVNLFNLIFITFCAHNMVT